MGGSDPLNQNPDADPWILVTGSIAEVYRAPKVLVPTAFQLVQDQFGQQM